MSATPTSPPVRARLTRRSAVTAVAAVAVATALVLNPVTSEDAYRTTSDAVAGSPPWVHTAVELVSEGGVLVLAALFAVVALTAWRVGSRLRAVTSGAAVVAAYATSEVLKLVHEQERPCWAVAGARAVTDCPPAGDWSLPSNHAAVAAALATAVLLLAPRLWAPAVAVAAAVGAARVGLGVHYPHDVVDGMVVGATVVLLMHATAVRTTGLADRYRRVYPAPHRAI